MKKIPPIPIPPDRWLQGFCQSASKRGIVGMEALREAAEHWAEQCRLEDEFQRLRKTKERT